MKKRRFVMLFAAAAALLDAQTVVNGGRAITGSWDASGAISTRPVKTGATIPAACLAGEMFFSTTAAAGRNLFLCQPDNVWTQISSSASAKAWTLSRTASNTLTIGGCSVAEPCYLQIGGTVYSFTGAPTITLSGGAMPTVRVYVSDGSDGAAVGTLKVRSSTGSGVTCSAGCTVETNQAAFPGNSYQIGQWTASAADTWDATGANLHGATAEKRLTGGEGISIVETAAERTVAVARSAIPQKFSGTAPPGSVAGNLPGDFYTDTTAHSQYVCNAPAGTAAPACTAVTANEWISLNNSAGNADSLISGTVAAARLSGTGLDASVFYEYDDFIGGGTAPIGKLNWGPSGTAAVAVSVANHPGVAQVTTAATVNAVAELRLVSSGSPILVNMGAGMTLSSWEWENIVELDDQGSGAIADAAGQFGFYSTISSQVSVSNAGIVLAFDTSKVDTPATCSTGTWNNANWWAIASRGGAWTCVDTGIPVNSASWYHLRIESTTAGTVTFSINGSVVATVSANVPTTGLKAGNMIITRIATAKRFWLDRWEFKARGLTR